MKLPPKKNGRPSSISRLNTLLIDGSSLFKRGINSKNNILSNCGQPIGGLYYTLTTIKTMLEKDVYHKVYVFFDGKRSGIERYKIYPEYKQSRGKNFLTGNEPDSDNEVYQMELVREYLYNLSIIEVSTEFTEADDYIAYYAIKFSDNEDITIATSDRDLCTLISDNISVYLIDKKILVTYKNYKDVFEHHVGNLKLIKIVCGDTSDNIKGITGLKEVTLSKILPEIRERVVTLDDLLTRAKELRDERVNSGKTPLKIVDNILNVATTGSQGNNLFEVNRQLVDLSEPKITYEDSEKFDALLNEGMMVLGDFNQIHKLISRDGIDQYIAEYYMSDWLLPFKKFVNRITKINQIVEQ